MSLTAPSLLTPGTMKVLRRSPRGFTSSVVSVCLCLCVCLCVCIPVVCVCVCVCVCVYGGAAASEGGNNNVALQTQHKRPRTSSIREVELVRKRLLACAFPGVQDNTPVPKLKGLLFQHGLATCVCLKQQRTGECNSETLDIFDSDSRSCLIGVLDT